MSVTILVPDWGADERLETLLSALERGGLHELYGYPVTKDDRFGYVVVIKQRLEEVPSALSEVPLEYISIVQTNMPYRGLSDEWIHEDMPVHGSEESLRCSARIETYVHGNQVQQSIRATISGPCLSLLNAWFDDLVAGELDHLFERKANLPEQPPIYAEDIVAARKKLEEMFKKGFASRDRGEILFDCEEVHDLLCGRKSASMELGAALEVLSELYATPLNDDQLSLVRRAKRFINDSTETRNPSAEKADIDLEEAKKIIDDLFKSANMTGFNRAQLHLLRMKLGISEH